MKTCDIHSASERLKLGDERCIQCELHRHVVRVAVAERVIRSAIAVLEAGCDCPVQTPGMHNSTCETLRNAILKYHELSTEAA